MEQRRSTVYADLCASLSLVFHGVELLKFLLKNHTCSAVTVYGQLQPIFSPFTCQIVCWQVYQGVWPVFVVFCLFQSVFVQKVQNKMKQIALTTIQLSKKQFSIKWLNWLLGLFNKKGILACHSRKYCLSVYNNIINSRNPVIVHAITLCGLLGHLNTAEPSCY